MNSDLDLVRMGERLKEKEIRLLRLRRPTAGGVVVVGGWGGRKERTTAGADHLLKLGNFIMTVRMEEKLKYPTN